MVSSPKRYGIDRPPRRDRFKILTKAHDQVNHRITHLLEVAVVDAGTDMHVEADQLQLVALNRFQRQRHILVPDTVLAVFTAGVGFLTVTVTKTRVDAQPHRMPGRDLAQLVQHIHRTRIHRHFQFGNAPEWVHPAGRR